MGDSRDDRQEFNDLHARCHQPVVKFLWRRLPSEAVEDAVAEVFLHAWRGRGQRRGDELPWLYGIARRVVADHHRARGHGDRLEQRLHGAPSQPLVVAAEDQVLERMYAQVALRQLSPRDREALMLVSWDGLGLRQAARVAGCTAAAFAVRLHRARRRLERALEAAGVSSAGEDRPAAVPGRKK